MRLRHFLRQLAFFIIVIIPRFVLEAWYAHAVLSIPFLHLFSLFSAKSGYLSTSQWWQVGDISSEWKPWAHHRGQNTFNIKDKDQPTSPTAKSENKKLNAQRYTTTAAAIGLTSATRATFLLLNVCSTEWHIHRHRQVQRAIFIHSAAIFCACNGINWIGGHKREATWYGPATKSYKVDCFLGSTVCVRARDWCSFAYMCANTLDSVAPSL